MRYSVSLGDHSLVTISAAPATVDSFIKYDLPGIKRNAGFKGRTGGDDVFLRQHLGDLALVARVHLHQ